MVFFLTIAFRFDWAINIEVFVVFNFISFSFRVLMKLYEINFYLFHPVIPYFLRIICKIFFIVFLEYLTFVFAYSISHYIGYVVRAKRNIRVNFYYSIKNVTFLKTGNVFKIFFGYFLLAFRHYNRVNHFN